MFSLNKVILFALCAIFSLQAQPVNSPDAQEFSAKWVNVKSQAQKSTPSSLLLKLKKEDPDLFTSQSPGTTDLQKWIHQAGTNILNKVQSSGGGNGLPPRTALLKENHLIAILSGLSDLEDVLETDLEVKEKKKRRKGAPRKSPPPPPLNGLAFLWLDNSNDDNKNNIPDELESSLYIAFTKNSFQSSSLFFPLTLKTKTGPQTLWFYYNKSNSQSKPTIELAGNRSQAMDHSKNKYIRKVKIISSQNPVQPEDSAQLLQAEEIENHIISVIREFSNLQYFLMKTTNNWGASGKESVLINMALVLFDLPSDAEITAEDIQRVEQEMAGQKELAQLNKDQLVAHRDSLKIEIDNQSFGVHQYIEINQVLEKYKSSCRFISGTIHPYRAMLFAPTKVLQVKGYQAFVMSKEIARTPVSVLPIIAVSLEHNVTIRKESTAYIFHNKWRGTLDPNTPRDLSYRLQAWALSDGYQITTPEQLEAKDSLFIQEMIDFAIHHELGHRYYFNTQLNSMESGMHKGFSYFGDESFVYALHEPLADWAPGTKEYPGPLRYLLQLQKAGKSEAAKRILQVYLADNYFTDAQGKMTFKSQIDLAIILAFLKSDGQFDWEGLHQKTDIIYETLHNSCQKVVTDIIGITRKATYTVSGNAYNYDWIAKQVAEYVGFNPEDLKKPKPKPTNFYSASTHNTFLLMKKLSLENYQKIESLFDQERSQLKRDLLKLLAPQMEEKFGNNLEAFVKYQLSSVGL